MYQVTVAPTGPRATRHVGASLRATAAFVALCAGSSFAHAAQPGGATSGAEAVESSERHLSDRWIAGKVRAELFAVSGNESIHVHIKTVRGAVTLTGQVTSQDILEQFTRAAKRPAGVKSVDASGLIVAVR